jgi:hypothetical protein
MSKDVKIETIILPVDLYGCETWYINLNEEIRMRTDCRGEYLYLGRRKQQEIGENFKYLHLTKYCRGVEILKVKMDGIFSKDWRE